MARSSGSLRLPLLSGKCRVHFQCGIVLVARSGRLSMITTYISMFSSFLGRQRGKGRRWEGRKMTNFNLNYFCWLDLHYFFGNCESPATQFHIPFSIRFLSLEGSAERNLLASMTTMLNRFRIEVYFSEIIIVVSCCCGSCGWLRMNLMSSSEWARARFLKTFDHFLKMKNSQNNGKYGKYLKRGWIFVEKYLRFPVQFSTWRRVENLFTKS